MQEQYIERVVDLTEPEANQIYQLSVGEAARLCCADLRRKWAASRARSRWLRAKAKR